MSGNANNSSRGADLTEYRFHAICAFVEVRLSTDKDEVRLAREHIDDMRNDRLSFDFNQGLRGLVAGSLEALTKPGHWNDNLHWILRLLHQTETDQATQSAC